MHRQIVNLVVLLIFFSCSNEKGREIVIDVSADIVSPKYYVVPKTNEKIIIDGEAKENSWDLAPLTDPFIDIEGTKVPKYDTRIKMLWDDKHLYIFALLEEEHIWGNITRRDEVIYYNNDFEVFIDPTGVGINYLEIEINALGTEWDLLLTQPYRVGGRAISNYNLDNLETAVSYKGTVNDPSDIDSLWAVEMAIPISDLSYLRHPRKLKPDTSELWRINFSRVHWDHQVINQTYQRKRGNDTLQKEYNWVWSKQKVINMHEPEKWGYLQFTESTSTEGVNTLSDEFEKEKQVAYALFRETRFGKLTELMDEKIGTHRIIKVKFDSDQYYQARFFRTNFGFEYSLELSNGSIMNINDQGHLKIFE
jgi:hypothetical protein